MLCAAESDPFQGDNYRIAAVIHESILCPILNKLTVFIFSTPKSIQYNINTKTHKIMQQTNKPNNHQQQQQQYTKLTTANLNLHHQPAINDATTANYFPHERSTSNLIQRKTNSTEYHQHPQQQHPHHSPQHQLVTTFHNQEKSLEQESILKEDYILESDDMDMEVIEPSTTSTTTTTISAEYTMPTTKID